MSTHRIIACFSGGVTSAWACGWALNQFPREDVALLFHDTKEEDSDTYRFIKDMATALRMSITERSDGRSVTQIIHDEEAIPNNRMAFCSRILKAEQGRKYVQELRAGGATEIVKVLGFTAGEWQRIQRSTIHAEADGITVRFPLVENGVTKQQAYDWCVAYGVRPPRMYRWSEHANCVGGARGGRAYWLKVKENAPEVYAQRSALEEQYGHTFNKGISLPQLAERGLKRTVRPREAIEVGACECGD